MSGQRCDPLKGCWILSSCEWNEEEYICVHNPILDLTPYTGFVFCLIPIFLGTGVLGGLGSGMIKRPILNLLLNYPASIATQVGDCFLFATTSLNTFLLFFEKHPDHPELPLINFNISIIFNQAIPIAWCVGAVLQQLVPVFAIYIIQLCFLLAAIPILRKYTNRQKKLELDKRDKKVLIIEKIKTQVEIQQETNLEGKFLKQYQQFYETDHKKVQFKNLFFIIGSFLVNQTLILMRTNRFNDSIIGINPCTLENNLMILALIVANLMYTSLVYWNKRNEEIYKDLVQYRPEERYYVNQKAFWLYYLGGWLSGFFTGFIGMGGGLILVAFLLSQNVIAREAAGTAAFGSFMISLNGLIQLYLQRTITIHDIMIFFSFGFFGVLLISKPGYMLMNKYKIGYVVLLIDMIEVLFNIVSIVALIIINLLLFGFHTLTKHHTNC